MEKLGLVIFMIFSSLIMVSNCCNRDICGPIVTKCQLLKKCNCEMPSKDSPKECKCCSNCAACLEDKYPSCCSCVGMCEAPEAYDNVVNASSVEELNEPIPGLFTALTSSAQVSNGMWSVVSYPAFETLLHHKRLGVHVNKVENTVKFTWDDQTLSTAKLENCTVAFVKKCTSLADCKETCKSMGAAKFRWFHDKGCCQCVGDKCIDYGKPYPMCDDCHADIDSLDDSEDRLIFDEL